jgi:hypothetical protein
MVSTRFRIAGIVAAALIAACSSPPTSAENIESGERAAMAPLKTAYPDVVMGFDFHGPVVDVSIDMDGLEAMDDDVEAAMKKRAVTQWRSAWIATHPNQHGKLTIRIVDFRGNAQFTETTKA